MPKSADFIPGPFSEITTNYTKSRRINKNPIKVLDAPALSDDFYLNLIDWSNHNQLAVGLSNCIYLWNADTSKVTRLC
jgi:cell division cycle 20-like protein 1 (cofactor of APC complex)